MQQGIIIKVQEYSIVIVKVNDNSEFLAGTDIKYLMIIDMYQELVSQLE